MTWNHVILIVGILLIIGAINNVSSALRSVCPADDAAVQYMETSVTRYTRGPYTSL